MRKPRRTFWLALAAALGLMGVSAVSAQAAEFWDGSESSFLLATLSGAQVGAGKLLVPKRGIIITCQKGAITSGALETTTSGPANFEFKECTVLSSDNKELTSCKVAQPIKAGGTHLPGNDSGTKFVTFEPTAPSTTFTTITIEGEACAPKGFYPITGVVSAKITTNGAVVNKMEANDTTFALFKDTLKFGAFPAVLDASFTAELTGVHKGFEFGVA
jgi:hypothetical protein